MNAPRAALDTEGALETFLDTLTLDGGYNANVVLCGVALLGASAGMIGTFAMLKKQSLVADAFAHASLVGVASAFLLWSALGGEGRSITVLLLGAAVSGLCAIAAISWLASRTKLTADTATAAVSSASFGAGIVVLSIARRASGADQAGLGGLVFGSAASMTRSDVTVMAMVAGACLVVTLVFVKPLTAAAFNERFARTAGLPIRAIEAMSGALVAAITVAGLQAVGMLLVVAMLVLPPATARLWTKRVPTLLALGATLGAAGAWVGAALSASLPNAPAGALIVLTSSSAFAFSLAIAPERGVIAGWLRHRELRRRARTVAAR